MFIDKKKSRKIEEVSENISISREEAANKLEELTLGLILAKNEYFEYFKNKNIKGSLTKKVFQYLKEKNEESDIIRELKDSVELTKAETDEWEIVICMAINDFSTEERTSKLLEEIFISWFRIELKEKQKSRENISKTMVLKSIELKLNAADDFSKILDIYKEYEEIVSL